MRTFVRTMSALQQALVFLGHLGGDLRSRLPAQERLHPGRLVLPRRAAAFPPPLVAEQVRGLAHRDDHQQPPQAVPIEQVGEAALLGGAAEAVEGRQRHVLLVGHAARRALQLLSSQPDQAVKVALPQLLDGLLVAASQRAEPARDRPLG
jgi:hypothetical protein